MDALHRNRTRRLQINFYAPLGTIPSGLYRPSPALPSAPTVPPKTPSTPPSETGTPEGDEEPAESVTGDLILDEENQFKLAWEVTKESVTFTMELDGNLHNRLCTSVACIVLFTV